jgi:uncharacterized protein (TIGR03382 family)
MASLAPLASAQWTATSLHPSGYQYSTVAYASAGGHQYGAWGGHAAIWGGSAASVVDIHPNLPPQYVFASTIYASDGTQQGGSYSFVDLGVGNRNGACLWNGTATSWLNVHPSGDGFSAVYGIAGGHQVGYYQTFNFDTGGASYAVMWSGGTGLNYLGTAGSAAYGTDGVHHVGSATIGFSSQAVMWSGTPVVQTPLQPAGASSSVAYGVSDGREVGKVQTGSVTHAGYWSGTPDSWVDLNPAGATYSEARGIAGNYIVGKATIGGLDHAGLWAIDTGAWTDLQALLPATYNSSQAFGVSIDGNTLSVVGQANIPSVRGEAYLWTQTVPAPPTAAVLGVLGVALVRRRRGN